MSRYKIESIAKVEAPYGMSGECWYQFVISNDLNTINGFRAGKKKDVLKIVTDSVNRLNEKYSTQYKMKNFNKPVYENNYNGYF
jgi:hypothetical protein